MVKLKNKIPVIHFYTLGVLFVLLSGNIKSQQLNFINYTIEDGLVQSQATSIAQDKLGAIWIGTFGGISRFDGHHFYNYDKTDGLKSNFVFKVFFDSRGILWVGTPQGAQYFDGKTFQNIAFPGNLASYLVSDIIEDSLHHVYILCGQKLFSVNDNKAALLSVDEQNSVVSSVILSPQGNICAALNGKDIYEYKHGKWELLSSLSTIEPTPANYLPYFNKSGQLYMIDKKNIYKINNRQVTEKISFANNNFEINCVSGGFGNTIWIGTSGGLYSFDNGEITFYGPANGIASIEVRDILIDREHNAWFGTDPGGIYKLSLNGLYVFNKNTGLKGNVITAIVNVDQTVWVGMADGRLSKFDGKKFLQVNIPAADNGAAGVSYLFADSRSRVWINLVDDGLWIYDGSAFKKIKIWDDNLVPTIYSMYEDSDHKIWIGTDRGIYVYNEKEIQAIPVATFKCFSMLEIGKDSMLAGTRSDLKLITGGKVISLFETSVNCLQHFKNYIVIGTNDNGLIFWDMLTGSKKNITRKTGLTSNAIYSMLLSIDNSIWLGTGNGIQRVNFDPVTGSMAVRKFYLGDKTFGPECNFNAISLDKNGNIWFGTVNGISVYNPSIIVPDVKPLIYLDSVTVLSSSLAESNPFISRNSELHPIQLKPSQNHLTFSLSSIYLTNPADTRYKYILEGADTSYSYLNSANQVIYTNLSPGRYTFKAVAITSNGIQSANNISFSFVIKPHFYQQLWFKIFIIISLVGLGWLINYWRITVMQKRNAIVKSIRLEEQKRIRERTSEDLHDDLGNKITRIAVLTDILQAKTDKNEIEKRNIINQIKENAQSLYVGTKDIIWSLSPGNDNLHDVLERMKAFGIQLFEDTAIEFSFSGLDSGLRKVNLPLDLSRNLVMMMKEGLNNILKHSNANMAGVNIEQNDNSLYTISVWDNGKGISSTLKFPGNGLENMKRRAERIGASFEILKNDPQGVILSIRLKIPLKEG